METIRFNRALLLTAMIISTLAMNQLTFGQAVLSEVENVRIFGPIPIEKGMIISSREVKLKSHVNSKDFEKWINEYWNLEWEDMIPGFQSFIAKRDDEPDPYLYAYYLVFKVKNIKDPYYSSSEINPDWYREMIYYKPTKYLFDELFEYIETDPFFKNVKWVEVK